MATNGSFTTRAGRGTSRTTRLSGVPIAMGYVAAEFAAIGTPLNLVVRDVPRPARVVKLPFVATRYYRG